MPVRLAMTALVESQRSADDPGTAGPHRAHVRSPVDLLRLVAAVSLIAFGLAIANVFDSAFLGLSEDGRTSTADFPSWIGDLPATLLAVAVMTGASAVLVWTLATRRFRRLALLLTGFAAGAALSVVFSEVILNMVDAEVRQAFDVDAPLFRYS